MVDPAGCVRPGHMRVTVASQTPALVGGGVGFVDSARETNKARAVVKIYRILLNRGRYQLGFHPFDTTKTKIEKTKKKEIEKKNRNPPTEGGGREKKRREEPIKLPQNGVAHSVHPIALGHPPA